jgi:hypothetical protein
MATMYENLCGWGRVDICMTFHMRAFFFITLHVNLRIALKCHMIYIDKSQLRIV